MTRKPDPKWNATIRYANGEELDAQGFDSMDIAHTWCRDMVHELQRRPEGVPRVVAYSIWSDTPIP